MSMRILIIFNGNRSLQIMVGNQWLSLIVIIPSPYLQTICYLQMENITEIWFVMPFFAIDGNRIASNHLHGLVARQWADGGTRPANSLMRLSMGTLMDRLFLQVLLEIHAEKNVRYVR